VGAARLTLIEGMIGSGKTTTAVHDWQAALARICAAVHPAQRGSTC
jgi:deoxyadenosine/deoxycytidine kinase